MNPAESFCASCSQIKLAVSRKLCGAVIGQKGQTIRDFMQDSGATIRVQPLSELTPSDSERLVTISGARDKVLRAVALILNTVSSCNAGSGARTQLCVAANVQHAGFPVQWMHVQLFLPLYKRLAMISCLAPVVIVRGLSA